MACISWQYNGMEVFFLRQAKKAELIQKNFKEPVTILPFRSNQ